MTDDPPLTSPRDERLEDGAGGVALRVAPTWRRGLAVGIDALPLVTIWLLATFALASAAGVPQPLGPWNLLDRVVDYINARPNVVLGAAGLLALLLFALPLGAQLLLGDTPGARIMGVTLVDRAGRRPRPRRLAAHCALRVLSVALLLAGVLWALADPARRTLHDRLAGVWAITPPR
ncbi:MAG: hypothetical protein CSA66_06240 [Proteobacteria bacterium]|nr:MAG: hypothetical protein CSA66_06240 [Pseudomonadota bacterium]